MIENAIGHELKRKVDPARIRLADERIIVGNVDKFKADTGWRWETLIKQTIANMPYYWREVL